ncbi:MAG TPA: hypothetical protein VFG35_25475 [Actinoplanes sp.]|nr:hypothetical protein [Actinoplanes sp.]
MNDAELLPLRNIFAVPINSPTGLFITERVGIRGLKSTLVSAIQRSFSYTYPDYLIDVNALAPEEAVKSSLEEGELKGIRLVRYGIPRDLEERYYLAAHEKEIGTVEVVLKPERGLSFSKRRLEQALESDEKAGLLEWRGVEYHDIKLEVKVGKQTRTLTVTKDKAPRVTFPIADDAEVDAGGRPTDVALYSLAMRTAQDLVVDIGVQRESLLGTDFQWTDAMKTRVVTVDDIES